MKRLLSFAGIDGPVLYGGLAKVALAIFQLLIIALIAWRLPADVQGYYYTYLNLTALQVIAELGLGIVIVQVCSHLWASLHLDAGGSIGGDAAALSRLVSLGRLSFRWYLGAGVAAAVLIGGAGVVFFTQSPSAGVRWEGSWLLLCAMTGLKMALIPAWSLLEGCNQVGSLYRWRFLAAVTGGTFTAGALLLGGGLWAPSIGAAAEFLAGVLYLGACHAPFLRAFARPSQGAVVDWAREVLPLQLRIGGSWIAGYFISSLFTPVLFHVQGAKVAGQWGMTWSMCAMVTSISMLWVATKAPQFGVWIARREFETLDREFFRAASRSVAVAWLGAALVWTGIWLLHRLNHPLAARVLAPLPAGLLAASVVVQSVPFATSVYLRAHMKEPLTFPSIVQAVLMGISAVICARSAGALGAAAAYLGVVAIVGVPWSLVIWRRCRSAWHAPASPGGQHVEVL